VVTLLTWLGHDVESAELRGYCKPEGATPHINAASATRPVARFEDLVGHSTFLGGTIFAFTMCLKQTFLGATKFLGAQKKFRGALPPNAPVATGMPAAMP